MGKYRIVGLILGLVLVLSLGVMPSAILADDVYYYPMEDSQIKADHADNNYGGDTWLAINNWDNGPSDDHRRRSVMRIDDQTGGGNVTSVLLRLYYGDEFGLDAEGLKVRVYRLTRTFEEYEVTWLEYENGHDWTSEGGDWTTANYAEAEMPSEGNHITWNITEMALNAWVDDEEDLYVIIRFKYENETNGDDMSWSFFTSAEGAGGQSLKPRVTTTYDEEVQTPEVDSDINEYGSEYVKLNIYPTLYDWPSANVTVQVAPHGGAWTWESAVLNVTDNNAVTRTVGSLNHSTEYDVRAKLVYASGTVYSSNTTFTTKAYEVPTWDIDVDDIGVYSATVYAGWTDNTDSKTVYAKIAYRASDIGQWSYTSTQSSSATSEEFDWDVDLNHNRTYYYKGMFTIDGYTYQTDVEEFDTGHWPDLEDYIHDVDISFVQFRIDYECNDVDEIDLQMRIREKDTSLWTYSDTREGLTGNGTEYFLFEGLKAVANYEHEAIATFTENGEEYQGTIGGEVWTLSIDTYPVLSNLDASFVQPNIMRVTCDIVLNDVDFLDPDLYCKYKKTTDSTWSTSIDDTAVTDDGNWGVSIICGTELAWETAYDCYLVLDYTAGTNQTDADIFYTPEEPFAVETVGFEGVTSTSVRLHGRVQLGAFDSVEVKFFYWVAGTDDKFIVGEQSMTASGIYETVLGGLEYGQYYNFQAFAIDPVWLTQWRAGSIIQFRAGYWAETEPPDEEGVYGVYAGIWNWFRNSTAGHWTILLGGMGVLALIFYKRREVALIMCLMVLGIGIIVGWVDTWLIVLLAIGAGLTIWRFIGSRRGSAV